MCNRPLGRAAGRLVERVVYEGAPHGFHPDHRPSDRREDGWARALAFLKSHGAR